VPAGQGGRYDGGHKRNRFITNTLSDYVTYTPVCPGLPDSLRTNIRKKKPRSWKITTRRSVMEKGV
jgi:uncharacterized protein YbbK (DUF523 family)